MYAEKPEDFELFSTTDVARYCGCSFPTVRCICVRLGIQPHIYKTKNARASYYTREEMQIISDNYNAKGNDYKSMKPQKTKAVELAEDHSLVKDKRFLSLSYFPNVIPDCFKEVD